MLENKQHHEVIGRAGELVINEDKGKDKAWEKQQQWEASLRGGAMCFCVPPGSFCNMVAFILVLYGRTIKL